MTLPQPSSPSATPTQAPLRSSSGFNPNLSTSAGQGDSTVQKLEAEIKRLASKTYQLENQQKLANQPKPPPSAHVPATTTPTGVSAGLSFPNDLNSPVQPLSPRDKERHDQLVGSRSREAPYLTETGVDLQPSPEVKDWIKPQPSHETIALPKPIKDEFGEILLASTKLPKPNIELPTTRPRAILGLRQPIVSSFRWLAEWCKRVLRLSPGRVFFKKTS